MTDIHKEVLRELAKNEALFNAELLPDFRAFLSTGDKSDKLEEHMSHHDRGELSCKCDVALRQIFDQNDKDFDEEDETMRSSLDAVMGTLNTLYDGGKRSLDTICADLEKRQKGETKS